MPRANEEATVKATLAPPERGAIPPTHDAAHGVHDLWGLLRDSVMGPGVMGPGARSGEGPREGGQGDCGGADGRSRSVSADASSQGAPATPRRGMQTFETSGNVAEAQPAGAPSPFQKQPVREPRGRFTSRGAPGQLTARSSATGGPRRLEQRESASSCGNGLDAPASATPRL